MSPIKKKFSHFLPIFFISPLSFPRSAVFLHLLPSFRPPTQSLWSFFLFLAAQSGRRMQQLSRTPLRLWQVLRISLGEFRFSLILASPPMKSAATRMNKTLRRTCVLTFKCAYGEQNRATTKLTQSHYGEIQFRLLKPARLLGSWLFRLNLKQKHCTARCKYMAR